MKPWATFMSRRRFKEWTVNV